MMHTRKKGRALASHTAAAGVRERRLTPAQSPENGKPWSRAKAKTIREVDVTHDRPQNHIASVTIQSTVLAKPPPSACWKMWMNGLAAAAVAFRSLIASVTRASIR